MKEEGDGIIEEKKPKQYTTEDGSATNSVSGDTVKIPTASLLN